MMGRKSLADSSSRADFYIDLTAAWTVSCMVPKGLYQFNSESLMKPTSYAMAHKSQETYYGELITPEVLQLAHDVKV
jgi:hypothetical protein